MSLPLLAGRIASLYFALAVIMVDTSFFTWWFVTSVSLLQHNTCPVCRKELPVDQELQRQQQQERQQRFEQEVQRQPAGLQSLFSALNPFHLFGGGPGGAAGRQGRAATAEAATQHGGAPAAPAAAAPTPDRLPGGTMERFEVVQTSLRELEVSSRSALGCGCCVVMRYVHCSWDLAEQIVTSCMHCLASQVA